MKIQMLTLTGKDRSFNGDNMFVHSFHNPESFDLYDITIINLQDQHIWKYQGNGYSIDSKNNFLSMAKMIGDSTTSRIVILLPQNYDYVYNLSDSTYIKQEELKDIISQVKNEILTNLFSYFKIVDFMYDNNQTKLDGVNYPSAFSIQMVPDENVLTRSEGSKKITTANILNVVLSTILLDDYEAIIRFLRTVHLMQEIDESPGWMQDISMFDDDAQSKIIEDKEQIISEQRADIEKARTILAKNNRYKSILYTTGDQLVEIVFDILQEMLGCDLSGFVDEKKEDFRFEAGNKVFIGEVKEISTNVKKTNISQLDVHVQEYLDEHENDKNKMVALLIINHQRIYPLDDRQPVPKEQIKLAKNRNCLIIETISLLRLFEQFCAGEIDKNSCIKILSSNTGILELE